VNGSVVDPWSEQLRLWLVADTRKPKRERRTAMQMYDELRATGYDGSYGRICAFIRTWKESKEQSPRRAFVPLTFEYGEGFQFEWGCEYVFVGALRKRFEVAGPFSDLLPTLHDFRKRLGALRAQDVARKLLQPRTW
jgi:hypothetical protein